jgi:hypothetical protein
MQGGCQIDEHVRPSSHLRAKLAEVFSNDIRFCHSATCLFSYVACDQVQNLFLNSVKRFHLVKPTSIPLNCPILPIILTELNFRVEEELPKAGMDSCRGVLNAFQICVSKFKAVWKSRFLTVLQIGNPVGDDISTLSRLPR